MFLIDARFKFYESLYLHCTTLSICNTYKVPADAFLLYFAFGTSLVSVQQYSASILGLHLSWYLFCMVEIS